MSDKRRLDGTVPELNTAGTPLERLLEFERRLSSISYSSRMAYYDSQRFDAHVVELGSILKSEGVAKDAIIDLATEAGQMKVKAKKDSPHALTPSPFDALSSAFKDDFREALDDAVEEVSEIQANREADRLLKAIEGNFVAPLQKLTSMIPNELAASRKYLDEAIDFLSAEDRVAAVVSTRKAWESCVTFALSRLPPNPNLERARDKAKYVWAQLGQQDNSGLFVNVKQLFEGAFLHKIEGQTSPREPEVAFFIALTLGFVHLVSEALASSQ